MASHIKTELIVGEHSGISLQIPPPPPPPLHTQSLIQNKQNSSEITKIWDVHIFI